MEYLFVYGLFRESARNLLGDFVKCGRATIDGKIYKVNEFYPGLIEDKKGKVIGEVFLINPKIFPTLDNYEGDEYTRKKIKTSTDLECWVYVYKLDITNLKEIEGGDWLLR